MFSIIVYFIKEMEYKNRAAVQHTFNVKFLFFIDDNRKTQKSNFFPHDHYYLETVYFGR